MPADQAAGLRRRRAEQPRRCLYCFFDSAESVTRFAQAWRQRGAALLLVDACGRLTDTPTRSLFDWRQQIERGQLHILPLAGGDGWHAPGVRADEPVLRKMAVDYDCMVFDAGPVGSGLSLMEGAAATIILELGSSQSAMLAAYALLKTLSHAGPDLGVGLLGDKAACGLVEAACSRFLGPSSRLTIYNVAEEGDAIIALAVRMADEEAGRKTR